MPPPVLCWKRRLPPRRVGLSLGETSWRAERQVSLGPRGLLLTGHLPDAIPALPEVECRAPSIVRSVGVAAETGISVEPVVPQISFPFLDKAESPVNLFRSRECYY